MGHITIVPWSDVIDHAAKLSNKRVQALLKRAGDTRKLTFRHIEELLTSDTGLKTFELSGHIKVGAHGNIDCYVDTNAVGYDKALNRPVSMSTLHALDPVWHLHPVNTMPFKDPVTHTFMSNFFSQQDVDFCVTNPMTISVIFNKMGENRDFPFPCIYVFMFVPHIVQSIEHSPTADLFRRCTAYQREVVPEVLQKIQNYHNTGSDCEIDWPRIADEFRRRGIRMRYMYRYDEFELYRIIKTLQTDHGVL